MKKSTILVVDDELFFRRLYAEILSEEGYTIETASSGDEALKRLREGGVDIVLTDLVMPGLSGMEVLRLARSMANPAEVILATGHATLETAIQALKNGARDYLIKPFDPEELRHLIRTCLEQRRLLDENLLLKSQICLFQRGQSLASQLDLGRLMYQSFQALSHELGNARGLGFLMEGKEVSKLYNVSDLEESSTMKMARDLVPRLSERSGIQQLKARDLSPEKDWPPNIKSISIFPMSSQDKIKGAIVLFNNEDSELPDPLPVDKLLFLSEQTALGFDNACRYNAAQQLVYTDDLTGLYNYRYLQMVLDREIMRTDRYGLQFSLVFIDLDFFKKVNDTYGHLAGSQALKETATLLRRCVRETDILFRYGGDEFTALLVETGARGAGLVAERIRTTIEQHTYTTDDKVTYHLTGTVGYATFPDHANNKRQIIDLADRAMYDGKRIRNIVRGAGEVLGQ